MMISSAMDSQKVRDILMDEISARILLATLYRPMTASQIVHSSKAPVAKVFRRIKILERAGLLRKYLHIVDRRGDLIPAYLSELRYGHMFVDRGHLKMRFKLVADSPKTSDERSRLL